MLGRELLQFRVKVKLATGNETFESWREREHDDLVLSVALQVVAPDATGASFARSLQSFRASAGSRQIVFRIDPDAKPDASSVVGRLLRLAT